MNPPLFLFPLLLLWTLLASGQPEEHVDSDVPGCGKLTFNSDKGIKLPWEAKIERQNELIIDVSWTAIVLTENLVLTAISSVWESSDLLRISPFDKYTVYTNLTNFGSTDRDDPSIGKSKITHLRLHPNYQLSDIKFSTNNYILAHLKTPLIFDSQVNCVCLASDEDLENIYPTEMGNTDRMFISGWNKQYTTAFRQLVVNDNDYCNSTWMKETKQTVYENHTLCANVTKDDKKECLRFPKGVVALNDVYNNGKYYFMSLLSVNEDCMNVNTVFIPQLDATTVQWIRNNIKCGPNNYTCNNGECVSLDSICNETSDCSDDSDEDPTLCHDRFFCKIDEFTYWGANGKNSIRDKLCDSVKDCENGEDEENCPSAVVTSNTVIWKVVGPGLISVIVIFGVLFSALKVQLRKADKTRDLTDGEVKEFIEGSNCIPLIENAEVAVVETVQFPSGGGYVTLEVLQEDKSAEEAEYLGNLVRQMKWDPNYEIDKSSLFTNKKQILGGGEYGVVCRGVLQKGGNYSTLQNVAIKTVKSCNDIEHFKALLSELKVLVYLGRHENLVEFIGANTSEIRQRNLEVIMELCPHGNLESYLQSDKYSFVSLLDSEGTNPSYPIANKSVCTIEKKLLTTLELLHWCQQIANAMDFLTFKHVIHGDLAIRNVLLSLNFIAKISDFGLSTKLYEYKTYYTRKNAVPLPLPWLSIESIRYSRFTHKSDVWSYGVTAWEIFTLGKVPYEELECNFTNFYIQLCNNVRLEKPPNATPEMYNLMRSCWNYEPSARPTFDSLKKLLAMIESEMTELKR